METRPTPIPPGLSFASLREHQRSHPPNRFEVAALAAFDALKRALRTFSSFVSARTWYLLSDQSHFRNHTLVVPAG